MPTLRLELNLPDEQIKLLAEIAESRQSGINSLVETVITEWLEQENKRRRARQTLTQFSRGIGKKQNSASCR